MKKFPISIRSMTAYGEFSSSDSPFYVKIQSVNRRYLEVSLNLSSSLSRFEPDIRKWISQIIGRGQVNITIFMRPGIEKISIIPNLELAKEIKKGWDLIADELNLSSHFSLTLLAEEKNLFFRDEAKFEIDLLLLEKAVRSALEMHQSMRESEGHTLFSDIDNRLKFIAQSLQNIENVKDKVFAQNVEKMRKKIAELFTGDIEERVLKEAAILSEKLDITEEIVRFHSLFDEFQKTISKPIVILETKGKKLDFLLQELSREINTLGSKAMSSEIAKSVINIKSELEKIREQVQNIE